MSKIKDKDGNLVDYVPEDYSGMYPEGYTGDTSIPRGRTHSPYNREGDLENIWMDHEQYMQANPFATRESIANDNVTLGGDLPLWESQKAANDAYNRKLITKKIMGDYDGLGSMDGQEFSILDLVGNDASQRDNRMTKGNIIQKHSNTAWKNRAELIRQYEANQTQAAPFAERYNQARPNTYGQNPQASSPGGSNSTAAGGKNPQASGGKNPAAMKDAGNNFGQ